MREVLVSMLQQIQALLTTFTGWLPRLLVGIIVGVVSIFIAGRLRRWGQNLSERFNAPPPVEQLIVNVVYVLALVLGGMLTLSVMGVNVVGLAAGLGIGGLIIGFALKDIIENLMAGVLLLLQQPFQLGNVIEVAGVTGTVINIQIRATTLRTPDNVQVIIPNSTVYSSIIKDFSIIPLRRRQVELGLVPGENLPQAIQSLLETVRQVEGVARKPAPAFALLNLEDGGKSGGTDAPYVVAGVLYYYIDTRQHSYIDTHSRVVAAIQQAALSVGVCSTAPMQVAVSQDQG
jgi:small conductance mechanosensitive channel